MDVKDAILKRRSIRRYLDREVSEDLVDELIEAARLAPSGVNSQPWKFLVVRDFETKKKLGEKGVFAQSFACKAPLIVVCLAELGVYEKALKVKNIEGDPREGVVRDLSIACQNLVLRATELGLGTCYIGWMDEEKLKKILEIDGKFVCPYVITVGYPDEDPDARPRKPREEIIFR